MMWRAFTLLPFMMWGAGLEAQSAYPEPDLRLVEGDWLVECYGAESRNGNCQLYQRVLMNNGTEIALVVAIAYAQDGSGPFLQMALPLGSEISSGARIEFSDVIDLEIPFTRCTDQGCLVEGQLTEGLLNAMKNADAGFVTIQRGGQPLRIPLSLSGFPEGISRISP